MAKAAGALPRRQLAGNALPGAWLPAAVQQHAEHLVSFDRDFRKLLPPKRFTFLKAWLRRRRVAGRVRAETFKAPPRIEEPS